MKCIFLGLQFNLLINHVGFMCLSVRKSNNSCNVTFEKRLRTSNVRNQGIILNNASRNDRGYL